MRGVFKLSLATGLAAVLLLITGAAFAQDDASKPSLKITGLFSAAFGQISYDKSAYTGTAANCTAAGSCSAAAFSEYETSYEHRIRFIYGNDELSTKLVFRPRGSQSVNIGQENASGSGPANAGFSAGGTASTGTATNSPNLADIYGEVSWNINKQMNLNFGRFEGDAALNPLAGTYLMANPVMNGPEYGFNQTNQNGIMFSYLGGPWKAGVAIYSQCRPSCGQATTGGAPNQSGQTIVPFFDGKFGDIAVRAQLPQTSGTVYKGVTAGSTAADSTQTVTGSGSQIGVAWTGMPGMTIALDLQSFVDAHNTTLAGSASKDFTTSGTVLKFEYMGFQLGYFDQTRDNGGSAYNSKPEFTYTKLVYKFAVGPGYIGPEYTTATLGKQGAVAAGGTQQADANATLIRIVGGLSF